jgi:hypothetical protein
MELTQIIRWCRVRLTGGAPVCKRLTAMWAVLIDADIFAWYEVDESVH